MTHVLWYPGHELILNDIVQAENCRLLDSRGNRYVDLESGVWCTSVGHANPRILKTIRDQLALIGHTGFNYTSAVVEEAAQDLLSILGFHPGKCAFLCSGSEAVEYGVRVAQSLSDRPLFLTMADSYFGAYGSASRKRSDEWHLFDWMECRGCSPDGTCDGSCERWASIPFEKIGGFLFEPGSSSGLVRFPPLKLVQKLVRAIQDAGGFVLVNEVTTGVGRTGMWFGYQHYGFSPDIVATGKGIGNGYPVSVAAFGPRVIDRLGEREVKYAQSHQNDPVGAAVVREVIRLIREEGLIERARTISETLLAGLARIVSRTGAIREIRARGLMIAVELAGGPDASSATRVHRELLRRGFIVGRRPGTNVLRIDPSLTIENADIAGFLAAFEETLAAPAGA